MIWSSIILFEFILWIIDETLVMLNFIVLVIEAYKKHKANIPAAYDAGLAGFFLINFIAYSILVLRHFFYQALWESMNIFLISREITQVLTLLSLVAIMIGIERDIIKRTRYILSILMSIYIVVITILMASGLSINILAFPFNLINLGLLAVLPAIFIYIAVKYSGKLRKNSLIMLVALLLLFWGGITSYENFEDIFPTLLADPTLNIIVRISSVLYIIVGLLILAIYFIKTRMKSNS